MCQSYSCLAFANLEQFSGPVLRSYLHPFLFRVKISLCHAVCKACRYSRFNTWKLYTPGMVYSGQHNKKITGCPLVFRIISLVTHQAGDSVAAGHAHIITVSKGSAVR